MYDAAQTFEHGGLAWGQRGAGFPLLLADGCPVANLVQVADPPESRVPEAQGQASLACLHVLKGSWLEQMTERLMQTTLKVVGKAGELNVRSASICMPVLLCTYKLPAFFAGKAR